MSEFTSNLGEYIESLFEYRKALGYSGKTHYAILLNFDRFFAANYPSTKNLTEESVLSWIENGNGAVYNKCTAIRLLGKYMCALGKNAYILPDKYVTHKSVFAPYIFSDEEMTRLFHSIDHIKPDKKEPSIHIMAPVLFRLIYTCGLRPNEGRNLKYENIYFPTGEILIVNTKKKKERMVVMSKEMCSLLYSYHEKRSLFTQESNYCFPSIEGGAISSNCQARIFKTAWKEANPGLSNEHLPNVRVYDLRHRFASATLIRWLNEGKSLKSQLPYLRQYMGHNTLSETYSYIHILPENLTQSSAIDWTGFYDIIPEVQYD